MSSDLVGRPSTSFPSCRPDEGRRFAFSLYPDAESAPPITMPERLAGIPGRSYVPYVGDLVNLGIENSRTIHQFLFNCQAVDFSTPIGQGASFTVTRIRVPKPGRLEQTTFSQAFTTTLSIKPIRIPDFVAYKTARVAFEPTGEPVESDQRAMFSAFIEVSALAHGPLARHPNIVKLLGLAWGSNPFDPLHKLPILVVEYAQFGSLADLQERQALDSLTKLSICLDVALGLEALHQCGIVHGDLKTENVLVFSDERGSCIAKLADFGFSIVEKSVDEMVFIGGTWPWKAPETNRAIERHHLKHTDVYSFGLMVWRVACDGLSPFKFISPEDSPRDRIEALKQSGDLVRLCELEHWYCDFAKDLRSSNMSCSRTQSVHKASTQSPLGKFTQLLWVRVPRMAEAIPRWLLAIYDRSSPLDNAIKDPFYGIVEPVLKLTLQSNPPSRDLAEVITMMQNGAGREPMIPIPDTERPLTTAKRESNTRVLSWRRIAAQEPAIQAFLVETLRQRAEKAARDGLAYHGDMFILAACYANGYGLNVDYEKAKSTLCKAADGGHYISMAYFYRICHSMLPEFRPSHAGVQHICDMALCGCRTALEDLAELAPEVVPAIKSSLKHGRGGVGADWYFLSQLLYGLHWNELIGALHSTGVRRSAILNPQHILGFKVNKRGDSLLHFASSCANPEALEALLRDVPFDIDSCNDQGDTALLCAARAGQVENTTLLLGRGANVDKASVTGETPLHWLISFEGEEVIVAGRGLLERGARVCATTVKQVAHSNFPATLETDRLYCGTPLDWAVQRNRPDIVSFLLDGTQDSSTLFSLLSQQRQPNPLGRAAFYHHPECLEAMLKAMEEAAPDARLGHGYLMKPLLVLATSGADLFGMALRHGSQWENRLWATFDLLLRRSRHRNFLDGLGNEFGETLLYHAIAGEHDAAVQYLLSPHVERLLAEQAPEISAAGVSSPTSRGQQQDIEEGGLNHAPICSAPVVGGGQGNTDGQHVRGILDIGRTLYTKIREALYGAQPAPDPMYAITFYPPDPLKCRAGAFHPEDILRPCATTLRPPVLEAIRWNRKHIYDLLLSRGADPNAKSRNPFHSSSVDWTAIHTFAYAGHNADFGILEDLVYHQAHPVEGRTGDCFQTETPLLTSIYSNSFNLSKFLLATGADINACSTSAGPLATGHPTTILGHIIASSANGSISRLAFLCDADSQSPEFIVEPDRSLTALHRCAMGNGELHWTVDGQDLTYPEYNFENNQEIMAHLLGRWRSSEEINRRCDLDASTALHLAVAFVNVGAVQELLETGNIDKNIRDSDGATAEEICIQGIHTLESAAPEHAGAEFENYINSVYEILHMLQDSSVD